MKKAKNQQEIIKDPARERAAKVIKEIVQSEGIISAIGDGIRVLDRKFMILYDNQVHKNMMGDHIGEYCYKAYKKQKSVCSGCPVELTYKTGKVHTVQREIETHKGVRHLEITASPLKDSRGKIIAGIEIVRDITDRRTAEQRLKQSEKLLSSILQALDGLLVVLNRDLQIIYSNWKDHDFVPEEEKQGMPYCYEIFKRFETPCDYCPPLKTFADGKFRTYEDRNPIDGRYKEIYVSPVIDDTGNVLFVIEYVRDITERKQAEELLRMSEAKFKSLSEESPNMIFINYKRRVVYANKKCEEIMGYTRDEFYSERFDFRSLIAPEYLDLVSSAFQKHMQGEEVPPYEYAVLTKDGKRLEVIITTNLIEYENDKAILGIITDITERKKIEEEVKRSKRELGEHIKELEDFYNMAVGRELRMKQLKEENEELRELLKKYEKS